MDLLMDLDHFEVATNVAKPLLLLVGLTRIELVTSSLSGMRSNQLSYSPELLSGEMSLLALSVTLNRGYQNLFFQYRYPNSAYKISNQVEHRCPKHPHNGQQSHQQQPEQNLVEQQLPTVELERFPPKRHHKTFNVVNGSRCRGNTP
jgi:hypothetical protein